MDKTTIKPFLAPIFAFGYGALALAFSFVFNEMLSLSGSLALINQVGIYSYLVLFVLSLVSFVIFISHKKKWALAFMLSSSIVWLLSNSVIFVIKSIDIYFMSVTGLLLVYSSIGVLVVELIYVHFYKNGVEKPTSKKGSAVFLTIGSFSAILWGLFAYCLVYEGFMGSAFIIIPMFYALIFSYIPLIFLLVGGFQLEIERAFYPISKTNIVFICLSLVSCVSVAFLPGVGFYKGESEVEYYSTYTNEKWKDANEKERGMMANSFMDQVDLKGQDYKAMVYYLGNPDYENDEKCYYYIGYDWDCRSALTVEYSSSLIVDVYKGCL